MNWIERIEDSPKKVRSFGLLFGLLGIVVTVFLFYHHRLYWPWPLFGAIFFLICAFWGYPVLRPVYIGWMSLAYLIAWMNTRVLLGLFFYLVITPIGLAIKITGKDLLDQKSHRSTPSYWIKRKEVNRRSGRLPASILIMRV